MRLVLMRSLGAVFFTALAERLGTRSTLLTIGGLGLLVVAAGFFTPVRQRYPECSASSAKTQKEISEQEIAETIEVDYEADHLKDVAIED